MLMKGWVSADWAQTEHKRQARYYRLTPAGRKQLGSEVDEFRRVISAIERILNPSEA
jgi:DNA-binding PadR family transcriptional regulator